MRNAEGPRERASKRTNHATVPRPSLAQRQRLDQKVQLALATTPPPPNFTPGAWSKAAWLYGFGSAPLPTNREMADYWGDSEDTIGRELRRYLREGLVYEHGTRRFVNQLAMAGVVALRPQISEPDPQIADPHARAILSSTSAPTTPTASPSPPETACQSAKAFLKNEYEIKLAKAQFPKLNGYIERIEAAGLDPEQELRKAAFQAVESGATGMRYVWRCLDAWGFGDRIEVDETDEAEDDDVTHGSLPEREPGNVLHMADARVWGVGS